jgi:hypothetical protein
MGQKYDNSGLDISAPVYPARREAIGGCGSQGVAVHAVGGPGIMGR